jgi:PHP family Zn ribbon phosphoesterase
VFGNEFHILLDLNKDDFKKVGYYEIGCDIVHAREGVVEKNPGYDGVFGKIKIKK